MFNACTTMCAYCLVLDSNHHVLMYQVDGTEVLGQAMYYMWVFRSIPLKNTHQVHHLHSKDSSIYSRIYLPYDIMISIWVLLVSTQYSSPI